MADRIIAITGAAGVLGSAVAKAAAELPSRLALIDHAKDCPGPQGAFIQTVVDLTDAVQASAAIDAVA
jgi:nucleoside-diphosphate-sugar epimerase